MDTSRSRCHPTQFLERPRDAALGANRSWVVGQEPEPPERGIAGEGMPGRRGERARREKNHGGSARRSGPEPPPAKPPWCKSWVAAIAATRLIEEQSFPIQTDPRPRWS